MTPSERAAYARKVHRPFPAALAIINYADENPGDCVDGAVTAAIRPIIEDACTAIYQLAECNCAAWRLASGVKLAFRTEYIDDEAVNFLGHALPILAAELERLGREPDQAAEAVPH